MKNETSTPTEISFTDTQTAFAARSNAELNRMYLLFASMNNPLLVKSGTAAVQLAMRLRVPFVKGIVKDWLFAHFCGGESIRDAEQAVQKLWEFKIGTILDYSVEGEKTDESFDHTRDELLRTIHRSEGATEIPFCVFKVTGVAPFDLLQKIQEKATLTAEEEAQWQRAQARVDAICGEAVARKVRIFIDAEETWIQETIDNLAKAMMKKYNTERAWVYNTYQAYTTSCLANLRRSNQEAVRDGYYLGVKLVRGAYMEKERERAAEKGYPSPIQPDKKASDTEFDQSLKYCIEKRARISLCAGSHNEYSNYYLTVLMDKYNIKKDDPEVWFAQLFGMSDHISYNLAAKGYNVAKYVPYGPVRSVLPYLFRRAQENTSIAGQSSREFRLIAEERKRRKG